MQKVKLDQEILLIGSDFNLSVREDPKTRELHVGILTKHGEFYERMSLPNKLDLRSDKRFQTFTLRAIGQKPPQYGDGGGEVIIKKKFERSYSPQEFYDWQDRGLNKFNKNV